MQLADSRTIVALVDELLSARKQLVGTIQHRRPNRATEQARLNWPVLVNGQTAECYVAVTLYPNDEDLRFTICLAYLDHNIWRLDFEPMEHVALNPNLAGHEFSLATIRGPHCHRWSENRLLATKGTIPEKLPFRTPLENVYTWDNAFRHFCGETNIDQPPQVPTWPPRERLL